MQRGDGRPPRALRAGVIVAALLAIALAPSSPDAKPKRRAKPVPRDAAALQAKIEEHLGEGEVQKAAALVPAYITAQEKASAADTVAMVLALRTAAENFIAAGPDGAAAAETLMVEGLKLRTAHFGPDHLEVAKSYNMLSVFHEQLGHYETATQYKTRALDIRTRQLGRGDPLVARTEHEFGVLDLARGEFRAAVPHFEAALAVFDVTPIPDSTRLVTLLNDVAELRRIETRYAAAESCLQRSLALGSKLFPPDDPQLADQFNNLAGLYKDQGRYDETETLLDRAWAMRVAATPPDSGALATAALNLAETYRLQDRPVEAAQRYEQATSLARRALGADHPDLVWFLNQSAVFDAEQGHAKQAERAYREALDILEKAAGPAYLQAQTEADLAALLETAHRHAAAESLYKRALATREDLLGRSHPDVALTLTGLGQCVAAGNPKRRPEAGQYLDRAAAILDSTRAEPEGRIEVHAARARLRAASGAMPVAIDEMQVALDGVETLRPHRGAGEASRVRFLARHSEDAADMVDWCLQTGDVGRAIETIERSRARAFLDRIAAAPLDPLAAIPDAERAPLEQRTAAAQLRLGEVQQQLANLRQRDDLPAVERRRRIAALETERDASATELQRAQDAMLAASPVWRTALTSGGTRISAAEIAQRAPRDGMIVIYQIGAARSHVIAIPPPPARPEAWDLQVPAPVAARWKTKSGALGAATLDRVLGGAGPNAAGAADLALAPRLARVRGIGQLAEVDAPAPNDAVLAGALHDLWQVLTPAPLWEKMQRAAEVVVVPDAALCQLPFEALVVEAPTANGARYWLDAGPVVRYALSGMSLAAAGSTPENSASGTGAVGLSVSNPAYPAHGALEALPATARETAAIQAAFEPAPLTVLQGADATEPRVRAALSGKRWVHLATHGLVDRKHSELLAGLALTPPAKPTRDTAADGMLQLFEIYDLHLDCDLAVLSACETSAGAWVEGEGVYALSRGFLAAGSKRVVASLWSVEDESTAALVGDLFRTLAPAKSQAANDFEVARALRDAKRRIRDRKEWNAPFFWAPFVLTTRQ